MIDERCTMLANAMQASRMVHRTSFIVHRTSYIVHRKL